MKIRMSLALVTLGVVALPVHAQLTFTITGHDGTKTVTVTASGTFVATTTLNISNSSQFWNGYGDFVAATPPGTDFTLSSGITLSNDTLGQSSPVTNLSINNSVNPANGDIFSLTINPGLTANAGNTFSIAGAATFTLPLAFDFSDYFNGFGTFTTASTRNPFGGGPTVTLVDGAMIPEPAHAAGMMGVVALLTLLRRRRRIRCGFAQVPMASDGMC